MEETSLTLKISFQSGLSAQDYKVLRFDVSDSIRSVLQIICERSNIEFSSDFGLYLPPENSNMGGTWLHEERTLSSYTLPNQSLVEFKCRPRTIKILVDESQTLVPLVVDYPTTVQSVINDLCEQFKLKIADEYVLQDANNPLDPFKSLRQQFSAEQTGTLLLKKKAKLKEKKSRYIPFSIDTKPPEVFAPKMFGVPISQALQYSGHKATIPSVVSKSINWIEMNALDVEGIFRLSGSSSEIESYKEAFDRGDPFEFPESADPHAVAGLMKMYFRELPEPVIPYSLYHGFIQALEVGSSAKDIQVQCFSALIQYLPGPNRVLVQKLIGFLTLLASHREKNKMAAPNLAIVFAQNLFRDQDGGVVSVVRDAAALNSISKTLIENYETIFKNTNPNAEVPMVGIAREGVVPRSSGWLSIEESDFLFILKAANGFCSGICRGHIGVFPEICVSYLKRESGSSLPSTPIAEKPILPEEHLQIPRRARSTSTKAHESLDPNREGPGLEAVEKQICRLLESIQLKFESENALKTALGHEISLLIQEIDREKEWCARLETEIKRTKDERQAATRGGSTESPDS